MSEESSTNKMSHTEGPLTKTRAPSTDGRVLTIADCLAMAENLQDSDSARIDVELLLAEVLKKSRSYLYTWPNKSLAKSQTAHFLELLRRRGIGEPVAYILGRHAFWTLELEINSTTLIPRPETELLVELALDKGHDDAKILDLGTGSGAVALALASELHGASITGVDKIDAAVALANRNKQRNALYNVEFKRSDWFENLNGHFDIIVSNPPYVQTDDPHLQQGDVRFEPDSALIAGADGLDDIRIIVCESREFLMEGGWLMLEHGYNQALAINELLGVAGFERIKTVKDLAGNDRVTMACYG